MSQSQQRKGLELHRIERRIVKLLLNTFHYDDYVMKLCSRHNRMGPQSLQDKLILLIITAVPDTNCYIRLPRYDSIRYVFFYLLLIKDRVSFGKEVRLVSSCRLNGV